MNKQQHIFVGIRRIAAARARKIVLSCALAFALTLHPRLAMADPSDAVPALSDKGRQFLAELASRPEAKAFALSPNGKFFYAFWNQRDRSSAFLKALFSCNKAAKNICYVYVVNSDVVIGRYDEFDKRSADALERLKSETLTRSSYGDEERDYGVAATEKLRATDYHA